MFSPSDSKSIKAMHVMCHIFALAKIRGTIRGPNSAAIILNQPFRFKHSSFGCERFLLAC